VGEEYTGLQAVKVGAVSCHVKYIILSYLSFFLVLGIIDGFALGRMGTGSGHSPLFHQQIVSLAQEWRPPRWCLQGLHISTEPQDQSQVQLYFSLHIPAV
jgi:hypothetical protein